MYTVFLHVYTVPTMRHCRRSYPLMKSGFLFEKVEKPARLLSSPSFFIYDRNSMVLCPQRHNRMCKCTERKVCWWWCCSTVLLLCTIHEGVLLHHSKRYLMSLWWLEYRSMVETVTMSGSFVSCFRRHPSLFIADPTMALHPFHFFVESNALIPLTLSLSLLQQ